MKKIKLELISLFKTLDTLFINGFQEDFLKNINLSFCRWSLSDWWIKKLLMLHIHLKKWISWSKLFQGLVSKILLIGYQILPGTWFKHSLNYKSLRSSLKIWKKMHQLDSKIGTTNWLLKMSNFHSNGKNLMPLLSKSFLS